MYHLKQLFCFMHGVIDHCNLIRNMFILSFLKEQGVIIISIGIGRSIDHEELIEIANDKDHVFVLADFKYLKDKLNSIHKMACQASE